MVSTTSRSALDAAATPSVSWFLIVTVVVLSLIILAACVLLLIKFGHPDDKNTAWFPRVVVVAGLFLSFGTILALPLDVANGVGRGGGLRMDLLWQGIFVCIVVGVTVVLPYAFFFYESDNNPERSGGVVGAWGGQAGTALQYTLIGVIILAMVFALMKLFFDTAEIPLVLIDRDVGHLSSSWPIPGASRSNFNLLRCPIKGSLSAKTTDVCNATNVQWSVQVSFLVFCAAMLAFLGWFFFTVFCGIGFISLPFDMINEFRTRPAPLTAVEFAKQKIAIGKKAGGLLSMALDLQKGKTDLDRASSKKNRRSDRAAQNRLEAELHALKKEKRLLEESYYQKGGNPVWYFSMLLFGLIGVILSMTWFIHICYYVLPKDGEPFLNDMFIQLETAIPGFRLFGVVAFGVYSFYLLLCAIKGTFRVGLRVPWLMKIYPMELGNTMMNAFLFNTWLMLVCTIPVIQFCVLSFKVYARNTDVRSIFGTQVFYLKFFRVIWANSVFIWAMFCIAFLTGVSLIVNPKDKAADIERRLKELAQNNDVE